MTMNGKFYVRKNKMNKFILVSSKFIFIIKISYAYLISKYNK